VAAALAAQQLEVWVYSIAPFVYARPFEQIRNDIALHDLPVKLIGNGGGYGYGVMGPTHHAIDDYGALLTLPNMSIYTPVFDEDIDATIERAGACDSPAYIRMGRGEPPRGFSVPPYAPWRQLTQGQGPVVIGVGPLAGIYIEGFLDMPVDVRPNLWAVAELPMEKSPPPQELLLQIRSASALCVAEEHVRQGGFGSQLLLNLVERGISIPRFHHLHARAHRYDRYGSQAFLRRQSGLDAPSMIATLTSC
jgi:transketolase